MISSKMLNRLGFKKILGETWMISNENFTLTYGQRTQLAWLYDKKRKKFEIIPISKIEDRNLTKIIRKYYG